MLRAHSQFASGLLTIACCWTALWSQQASLTGVVKDRKDGTAINGAHILIGREIKGISGNDGRYLVQNIQLGSVTVQYSAGGYAPLTYDAVLTAGQKEHSVFLFKKDPDDAYYTVLATNTAAQARTQGDSKAQAQVFVDTWNEIDTSGLTPDVKAVAARHLSAVLPTNVAAPTSLKAYSQVDSSSIDVTAEKFRQALNGEVKMTGGTVPGNVAVDIAAKQITQYEKTSNKAVHPRFYIDFKDIYGDEAGTKLKNAVAVEKRKDSTMM